MDPAIYDVTFFTRDGNRYGKCWGENITMMQNVAKSKEFQVLIRTVRPLLESKVSQGAELHNVVFTCNQGRHRSVAAAKLFQAMLGTHLPFRCMCMCTSTPIRAPPTGTHISHRDKWLLG